MRCAFVSFAPWPSLSLVVFLVFKGSKRHSVAVLASSTAPSLTAAKQRTSAVCLPHFSIHHLLDFSYARYTSIVQEILIWTSTLTVSIYLAGRFTFILFSPLQTHLSGSRPGFQIGVWSLDQFRPNASTPFDPLRLDPRSELTVRPTILSCLSRLGAELCEPNPPD